MINDILKIKYTVLFSTASGYEARLLPLNRGLFGPRDMLGAFLPSLNAASPPWCIWALATCSAIYQTDLSLLPESCSFDTSRHHGHGTMTNVRLL